MASSLEPNEAEVESKEESAEEEKSSPYDLGSGFSSLLPRDQKGMVEILLEADKDYGMFSKARDRWVLKVHFKVIKVVTRLKSSCLSAVVRECVGVRERVLLSVFLFL